MAQIFVGGEMGRGVAGLVCALALKTESARAAKATGKIDCRKRCMGPEYTATVRENTTAALWRAAVIDAIGANLLSLRDGRTRRCGLLLRRRGRLGLGRFLLLVGRDDGVENGAFHAGHELDDACVSDVLDELVDDVVAEIAVSHLATTEAEAGFHLVATE